MPKFCTLTAKRSLKFIPILGWFGEHHFRMEMKRTENLRTLLTHLVKIQDHLLEWFMLSDAKDLQVSTLWSFSQVKWGRQRQCFHATPQKRKAYKMHSKVSWYSQKAHDRTLIKPTFYPSRKGLFISQCRPKSRSFPLLPWTIATSSTSGAWDSTLEK